MRKTRGVFREHGVWAASAGFGPDGARLRRSGFATAAEAKAWRDKKIAEKKGLRAQAIRDLSNSESVIAADAFAALAAAGKPALALKDAVTEWLARHPETKPTTVAEFHDTWLSLKTQRRRRGKTIVSARSCFKPFLEKLGEKQLVDVTLKDIEEICFSEGKSARTQINRAVVVTNFFNEAQARGLIGKNPTDNPCHGLRMPTAEDPIPTPWSLEEAQCLLDFAWQHEAELACTAGIAIALFAGLRTEELLRARYGPGGIDLDRGLITVSAAAAKKRRARCITMEANLKTILNAVSARATATPATRKTPAYGMAPGAVVLTARRLKRFRQRLAAAGVKWKHNGCRSAFGSFHYERGGDIERTCAAMGHTGDRRVFDTHYRALVSPGEGSRFFALSPSILDSAFPS